MSMLVNARSAHRWGFKCYCCIESRKPSGKRREARRIKRRERQAWKRLAICD